MAAVIEHNISDFGRLCVEHLPRLLGDIGCVVRTDHAIILTIAAVHPNDTEIFIVDDVEEDNALTVYFGGQGHLHYDDWIDEEGDTPQSRQEHEMSQLEIIANSIIYEIAEKRGRA